MWNHLGGEFASTPIGGTSVCKAIWYEGLGQFEAICEEKTIKQAHGLTGTTIGRSIRIVDITRNGSDEGKGAEDYREEKVDAHHSH